MMAFEVTEGNYYKMDIVDLEEHVKCVTGADDANCVCDSLELFYKLRNAGAKRVRGKRHLERETNDPKAFHYWVENKNIVFDKHGGVQLIVNKDDYYKNAEISDVEVGEYSGFFRDDFPTDDRVELVLDRLKNVSDKQLLYLINTLRQKFGLNPI